MKVLAIFGGYRFNKTMQTLPHSGLDYLAIVTGRRNRWLKLPPLIRLATLLPLAVWSRVKPYLNRRIQAAAIEFSPDLVYTNSGTATAAEVRALRRLGIPLVVRLGGHIYEEERENMSLEGLGGWVMRLVYKRHYRLSYKMLQEARHLVVVSEDMADRLARETRRPRKDVSVITVPCDIPSFDLQKNGTGNRILTVTSLMFRPKLQALMDFMPALDCFRDVKIIAPGRYRNILSQSARHRVYGYTPSIGEEYSKAAVFCYFSYLDGCPNVILEAWASRTPVIANRCAWSEELIKHGETGILVDTPDAAARAIRIVLDDKELRDKLVDKGYRYVVQNHSPVAAGRRLGEVLRSILLTESG
jgi:glycosyltransferase involved in cell wall biosynthesis